MAFQQDGTKVQLASGGASWIHDNPGTNPFAAMPYMQYSHFGMEDVQLTAQSSPTKFAEVSYILENVGDVCLTLYLKVKSAKYGWPSGGDANQGQSPLLPWGAERAIHEAKLYSGDTLLDQYDTIFQRYYYNVCLNQDQKSKWDKMTSITQLDPANSDYCLAGQQLYVPLLFGFCTHNDQSLPTVAMFNKKIRVDITIPNGSKYGNWFDKGTYEVWAKVAYLQGEELNRVKFTNEYLMLGAFTGDAARIAKNTLEIKSKIDMTRCVKELYFGGGIYTNDQDNKNNGFPFEWPGEFKKTMSYANVFTSVCTDQGNFPATENQMGTCTQPHQSIGIVRLRPPFTLSSSSSNISTASIIADRSVVSAIHDSKYYNLVQPYYRHSGCPCPGYLNYSWALQPEITQPTGHINSSLFQNIEVNSTLRPGFTSKTDPPAQFQWYTNMISITKKGRGMLKHLSQE